MKQETKLEIEELEKRRSILCDECDSLEQELRQYEDEIEGIDTISNAQTLVEQGNILCPILHGLVDTNMYVLKILECL